MNLVSDFKVKNKTVLVRCDFDVPLGEDGRVADDFRIQKCLATIEYLIKEKARVVLMAHLGRPAGRFQMESSLGPVQEKLVEFLGVSVTKTDDCLGEKVKTWIRQMAPGEVLLLENLRFYKEEEEDEVSFAKELAGLADIYINEAFGNSHREHASMVSVPRILPSGIGFWFAEEMKALNRVVKKPQRPLVGIIGGAKVETKLTHFKTLLEKVDFLLVGGKAIEVILRGKGMVVNRPLLPPATADLINQFSLTDPKLKMPIDVMVAPDPMGELYTRTCGPGFVRNEENIYDLGLETMRMFSLIIKQAKMVFWAGPLGLVEEKQFSRGSLAVAMAMVNSRAFSIVGGNNTIAFIRQCGLAERFDHLSSGGGAMLEYLAKGTLPAIAVLE